MVKEWVRRLQAEIYRRSTMRKAADAEQYKEQQGFIEGLKWALGVPDQIINDNADGAGEND